MKKKLLIGLACFAVIAAAVTVTISTINANTPKLSNLMSLNLEALTISEGGEQLGGEGSCCYNDVMFGPKCGVNAATAEYFVFIRIASNWCCDNCGTASWMK